MSELLSTSLWERQEEARKAAEAWREALLRLMPPQLLGREAFSRDHSDWGPPRVDSRAFCLATSNFLVARLMLEGGQMQMI